MTDIGGIFTINAEAHIKYRLQIQVLNYSNK